VLPLAVTSQIAIVVNVDCSNRNSTIRKRFCSALVTIHLQRSGTSTGWVEPKSLLRRGQVIVPIMEEITKCNRCGICPVLDDSRLVR